MNRQTVIIIISVVVLLHVGLFYLAAHTSALPKTRVVPRPNFTTDEQVYHDTTTGEKVTYREISVSTKLADPAMVQRMEERIAAAQRKLVPAP
jgi:flagellar basal body-associated protein FliL